MDLSLKEKFTLLAYHPEKGHNLASDHFGLGLGGAILLELAEMKKIRMHGNKVQLLDNRGTGDMLLDRAIEIIDASRRDLRVKALINKILHRPKQFKKPLRDKLVRERYLREVRKKFLVFPYYRYPAARRSYRKDLVEFIRRLVLRNEQADPEIAMLAGLAGACRFSKSFFMKGEERKTARKRIKEIVKESQVDTAIDETIKAVQAAVMISVTATTVAAGSSS